MKKINSFQILIGVSILIVAVAIAYYLVIYIPKYNKEKELQKRELLDIRDTNIANCLERERAVYYLDWKSQCKAQGRDENCTVLYGNAANGVEDRLKQRNDDCYKRYDISP